MFASLARSQLSERSERSVLSSDENQYNMYNYKDSNTNYSTNVY